jgi:BMFP domain-containing protein YqiC
MKTGRTVSEYVKLHERIEQLEAALREATTIPKPPTPLNDADMKLATDWYTWGFQSGMNARIEALEAALREIADKRKMDAVAAVSMQAIARAAIAPEQDKCTST